MEFGPIMKYHPSIPGGRVAKTQAQLDQLIEQGWQDAPCYIPPPPPKDPLSPFELEARIKDLEERFENLTLAFTKLQASRFDNYKVVNPKTAVSKS